MVTVVTVTTSSCAEVRACGSEARGCFVTVGVLDVSPKCNALLRSQLEVRFSLPMNHPHRLQLIDAHVDRPDGVKPSSSTISLRKEPSWLSELGFEPGSSASPPTTRSSAHQDEILGRAGLNSIGSSLQSFYTANTSLSHSAPPQTMCTNSTVSSNLSFPYSVTSINSYKSRKNVLYPRRAHPPPVTVSPEYIVSPNVRFLRFVPLSKYRLS